MSPEELTRREFLKRSAITGAGVVAAASLPGCKSKEGQGSGEPDETPVELGSVPTRAFGKSAVQVPALSLAAKYHSPDARSLLEAAVEYGVTYWDTSEEYDDGIEETGIGKLLSEKPGLRDKLFLQTKSRFHDPVRMAKTLDESLGRVGTDHVEVFLMQAVDDPSVLNAKLQDWVEKTRSEGKIRHFGFSSHAKVLPCLEAARKAGWIDAVMVPYNVRLMRDPEMAKAIKECREAGIAVTAIKFRALGPDMDQGGSANKDMDPLKIRALLQSEDVASVCAYVPDLSTLEAYVRGARDTRPPSKEDLGRMTAWIDETSRGYCAGCSQICEARAGGAPISDAARLLMYYRAYGDVERARRGYAAMSPEAKAALANADFHKAERACPYGVPIARWAKEASELLA